jgi:pyruvate dehydrogenase E2 component (dihydrolipoamide acetyltransferase)
MIDVVMPQMGESIVEGTLTKWLKKVGDRVERDEPLFEISTDKVDSEIPAPAAGVLAEVNVEEGKTVAINTVVGRINDGADSAADAPKPAAAAPAPAPPAPAAPKAEAPAAAAPPPAPAAPPAAPAPPAAAESEEVQGPLSPLVRRMAREYSIDLTQVKGTGAGGRITKADVETYMAAQGARTVAASGAAPAPAPAAPAPAAPTAP